MEETKPDHKEIRRGIINDSYKSIDELRKIMTQVIDLSELDPEKAKTAAASKLLAQQDALKILINIEEQEEALNENKEEDVSKSGKSKEEDGGSYKAGVEDFIR